MIMRYDMKYGMKYMRYVIWDHMMWHMRYEIFAHSACCMCVCVCVCVCFVVCPSIFTSATTKDVWIIPYLPIWGNMLNIKHVSCVITDCCQHQWVITPYLFMSCWSKTVSASENHYLKNCFFQNLALPGCFLYILFAIFSPYFLLVGLLL